MKKAIKAILCDLDGVLTQTAKLHAHAWKQMFDDFLEAWANQHQVAFSPFDITTDYINYIDGKPRREGVKSYLEERGIDIPEGQPNDSADNFTIYGLAARKNKIFLTLLNENSVEVFPDSIKALQQWKKQGMKMAVVSSSKNCLQVLEATGITSLFDVVVDGWVAEKEKLKGKPFADTFFYAAAALQVSPKEALVVEDAEVGIVAAKKGGFGLAVGVIHQANEKILRKAGADVLVHHLNELSWTGKSIRYPQDYRQLDDICTCEHHLGKTLKGFRLALFFDYDGTLTPIVTHPEDALLQDEVRESLNNLAQLTTVTIISGRDRNDVKKLVGLSHIFYAGSHGFDIEGPENMQLRYEEGKDFIIHIQNIADELRVGPGKIQGVQIEQKKFAVALHYRNVPEKEVEHAKTFTHQIVERYPALKTGEGKKVLEIRPNIDWDKGKAMQWIAAKLQLNKTGYFHIYVGDDITDEDAFRALPENGLGILVGHHHQPTYADYTVQDPGQVKNFLDQLIKIIRQNENVANRI